MLCARLFCLAAVAATAASVDMPKISLEENGANPQSCDIEKVASKKQVKSNCDVQVALSSTNVVSFKTLDDRIKILEQWKTSTTSSLNTLKNDVANLATKSSVNSLTNTVDDLKVDVDENNLDIHFLNERELANGKGWANIGQDTCMLGKYKLPNGDCAACAPGKFTDQHGQTQCKGSACTKGKYYDHVSRIQAVTCKICPSGKYADQNGSTNCKGTACVKGKWHQNSQQASHTCKACPSGQYTDQTARTSCKGTACVKGKWHANSQQASHTCKACPSGQYTDQTARTSCKGTVCAKGTWHANSQQASHTCKNCPSGKYGDQTARTSCKGCNNNSCDAGKVRTGSCSGANNGYSCPTYKNTCEWRTTPINDGGGGNSVYFDRHHSQCDGPQDYMQGWRLQRSGSHNIYFQARCCGGAATGTCRTVYTPSNDDGNGNHVYFDRHNLRCGNNEYMKSWRLQRTNSGRDIRFAGTCCKTNLGTKSCQTQTTSYNDDGNGNTVYFDRHFAQCTEAWPRMKSWRLQRQTGGGGRRRRRRGQIRFSYECCKA